VLLTDSSDIPALLAGFGETVIIKPIVGFSGLGVLKLPNSVDRVREALEPGQEYLLQEYLPEIADGERCLFFFAKKFRYAIVKRLHAGEYIANADHAEFEAYKPTAAELALACDAVERFGSSSLIERIDIVGSKVLEMTIDSPGLAIHIAGVEREVGHWTYEAIDLSIDARSRP
jgi:glutathione synthase/RimK-type ligase-like ATP-grasp enzyme